MAKKTEKLDENERVKMVQDRVDDIMAAVEEFTRSHVYVGVTEGTNDRGDGSPMGNAALAYVHNYGSYRAGIPSRPFMEPGIEHAQSKIEEYFMKGANAALDGDKRKANAQLMMAGGEAVAEIRNLMRSGIPPPLKDATVRNRWRQREGVTGPHASELLYGQRMKEGMSVAGLMATATPLINTGKLVNSITFVLTHDEF